MSVNLGFERDLKLLQESDWGSTPSSALELFTVISGKIKPVIDFAEDDEMNSSGMEKDQQIVAKHAEGAYNFNLRFCDCMHDIFQHALGASSWTSVSIEDATDIAFNATDNSLSSTTTDFLDNDMTIGMIVKISGDQTSGNQGLAKVTAITIHELTLSDDWLDLTAEAAGDAVTIAGDYIRNGSTLKGFTIEDEYTKVTQFESATGMTVRNLSLNMPTKGRITGSVDFYGEEYTLAQLTVGTGSETAASTSKPFVSGAGVDAFYIDDETTGVADTNLAFNWTRELFPVEPLDQLTPSSIGLGKFVHTLAADMLFENNTVSDYYADQDSLSSDTVIVDEDGNYYIFSIFTTKLNAADIPDTANDLVKVSTVFKAFENTSRSALCQITKIAA